MATLSPAALVKSGQAGSSSTVDPLRASAVRQPPISPSSSSSRMPTDSTTVIVGGGGSGGIADHTTSSSSPPVRRVISNDEFPAVDDLISKLPDVLFPFEGDTGDDELTPFKAVYGSSPGGGGGGGGGSGFGFDAHGGFGGNSNSPNPNSPKMRLRFGSAPERHGENTFGGRGSPLIAASPPLDRPKRGSSVSGGGGKYQPPNRRDRDGGGGGGMPFGSPPAHSRHQLPPRNNRGKHGGGGGGGHAKPAKKNPVTPGFNGAGFRSIREIYVSKVHDFLCARAIEGSPWVKLSGKDGVAAMCEKPLTVPENYTQFFRDHATMFELSPDVRYVAAKVPGEEHACIPPPPSSSGGSDAGSSGGGGGGGSGGSSGGGSGTPSLSSSPATTGGLLLSDELQLQDDGYLSFSMPPAPSSPSPSTSSSSQGPGQGQGQGQGQQQPRRGRSGKSGRALQLALDVTSSSSGSGAAVRSQSPGANSNSSHSSGDSKEGSSSGGSSGNNKVCMYLSRPGGCRAGDTCRFSHDVAVNSASGDGWTVVGSSGKPPKSPSMKIAKKSSSAGGKTSGGLSANFALPA